MKCNRNISYFTDLDQISLLLKYHFYVKYFFSIWFLYYSVFKEQQIYSLSNIPAHCSTNSDMHRFHVINERRRCNTLYCTSAFHVSLGYVKTHTSDARKNTSSIFIHKNRPYRLNIFRIILYQNISNNELVSRSIK